MDFQLQLRLPGLVVSSDKVALHLPKRKASEVGPFLLISRSSGLAIDTGLHQHSPSTPIGVRPHGKRHQLWWLLPGGKSDAVRLRSADNGLFLDADSEPGREKDVSMRRESGGVSQMWELVRTPDQIGVTIRSAGSKLVLAHSEDAYGHENWGIWFDTDHGSRYTEWLMVQPTRVGN